MEHFHSSDYIHGDMNSEDILVHNNTLKISNFVGNLNGYESRLSEELDLISYIIQGNRENPIKGAPKNYVLGIITKHGGISNVSKKYGTYKHKLVILEAGLNRICFKDEEMNYGSINEFLSLVRSNGEKISGIG
ncbi:hypothetical protein Glove_13g28 [Diversispora epigaea]|uniref:Protein kinase domain-containing protein n=1 Tax=Diversispora epigaea TaxID=1348612 RepID=A0A397JWF8_9GLOM|nr:hypothetical protein Glove_13g28 [Diversispora epigaea]